MINRKNKKCKKQEWFGWGPLLKNKFWGRWLWSTKDGVREDLDMNCAGWKEDGIRIIRVKVVELCRKARKK